jgi:hypothetical protein
MPLTFKERLKQRAKQNRAAFNGKYKAEIEKLHGLSRKEIDLITPDNTDMEVYAQLIAVVEEASATNESQAQLKKEILEMGEIAIEIAKKIPSLSSLF